MQTDRKKALGGVESFRLYTAKPVHEIGSTGWPTICGSKDFDLRLPLPQSVNALYKPGQYRKVVLTSLGKQWKKDAAWSIRMAKVAVARPDLFLYINVYGLYPDGRRRDLNNMAKLGCDIFQECGIVVNDDVAMWQEQGWRVVQPGEMPGIYVRLVQSENFKVPEKSVKRSKPRQFGNARVLNSF